MLLALGLISLFLTIWLCRPAIFGSIRPIFIKLSPNCHSQVFVVGQNLDGISPMLAVFCRCLGIYPVCGHDPPTSQTDRRTDDICTIVYRVAKTKQRSYDALVLSTVRYGAETWNMTVVNMKRLEAARHKWQRIGPSKILGSHGEIKSTTRGDETKKQNGNNGRYGYNGWDQRDDRQILSQALSSFPKTAKENLGDPGSRGVTR